MSSMAAQQPAVLALMAQPALAAVKSEAIVAVLKYCAGPRALALAAAAGALALQRLWKRCRMRPRNVPLVPGHWLLGNLPSFAQAAAKREHLSFTWLQHQLHGRTIGVKFPLSPWWVITTRPENVEHILSANFKNYPKGLWFRGKLFDLLGGGIFNADGQQWFHQRKTASRMFTASLFKEHIWVVVRRNARKLRNILEATEPGKPLDIFNLMNRFTLDTIGEIGFGKCIGSLEDPSSPFLQSFDRAQQIAFQRFYLPLWRLLRWLGLGFEWDTREHLSRLDTYSRSVVQELRAGLGEPKAGTVAWSDLEARKSFLGLFMADAQAKGEELSEDFLRDLVLNFLIAGRDTTAQALSWTIYCLCKNPAVEAKARKEIVDVCGVRGPDYEDMGRLPYLQAVLSEALRLYPSVPLDAKVAECDDSLPDGTFVPRGTVVLYNVYGMGRDPAIWGEDAETFRPERWLEFAWEVPTGYRYPVFNAGPRECLGKRLAMVEMKTCLAMLLPQVSFKLAVAEEQISPSAQLTIGMSQGLPCIVTRIGEKEDWASNVSTADASSDWASVPSELAAASSDADEVQGKELDQTELEQDFRCSTRRSGRARQRERQRRRVSTPSPDFCGPCR